MVGVNIIVTLYSCQSQSGEKQKNVVYIEKPYFCHMSFIFNVKMHPCSDVVSATAASSCYLLCFLEQLGAIARFGTSDLII